MVPGHWSLCLHPSDAQDWGHLEGEGSLLLSCSWEPRGGRWWASGAGSGGPSHPGSELSKLHGPVQLMETLAPWALGQVREERTQCSPGTGRRPGQDLGAVGAETQPAAAPPPHLTRGLPSLPLSFPTPALPNRIRAQAPATHTHPPAGLLPIVPPGLVFGSVCVNEVQFT